MYQSNGKPPSPTTAQQEREESLWLAVGQGSREAFADLYAHFIRDLLRYGLRLTANREAVQDAIQDVFAHLWEQRTRLGHVQSIRFYLYRSLRNRIIRIQQSDRLQPMLNGGLEENWNVFQTTIEASWIDQEQQQDAYQQLHAALNQLSARQQEAIQLRYYHNFSTAEIAQLLEVNEQSARNLLHRALLQLREILPKSLLSLLLLSLIQKNPQIF